MGTDSVNVSLDAPCHIPYRVNMAAVNDKVREAVRVELARRNTNQARLADRIGVSRQYLSDVMRGKAGRVPAVWQKILADLDLEITVRKKDLGGPE
jgi:predicted XRE-type DNA-binding protein